MRLFSLVSLLVPVAIAWGPRAHKQSAAQAYKLLSPSTFNVIPTDVGYPTDDERFVTCSIWADSPENEITGAYHFVHTRTDIDGNCLPYDETIDCGFNGSGECLVTGIMKYVSDILEESTSESGSPSAAYMMLIHLIADLHQPMHVGFAKDHGGLDIPLLFPEGYNLHELWDDYLVSSRPDCDGTQNLFKRERDVLSSFWPDSWDSFSPSVPDITTAVKQWIVTIVEEVSQVYTCPKAYKKDNNLWIDSNDLLDESYLSDRTVIANRLIQLSGVRLAVLLNRIGKCLNSMARAERKQNYKSEAPPNQAASAIPPSRNRFEGLTIEEFQFIPDDLVYRESSEIVVRSSSRTAPTPVFFHNVPLHELGLFIHKRTKQLYVTFISKRKQNDIRRGWFTFSVSFPLNPDKVGKEISLDFDLTIFECVDDPSVTKPDVVMATIYHIRGVGVPNSFKQSPESKSILASQNLPANAAFNNGIFEKLPLLLTKNIEPVDGNLYYSPHELTAFFVRANDNIYYSDARSKQVDDKKTLLEKIARAHAAKFAPHTVNQPIASLLRARNMFTIERVCGSLTGFLSTDNKLRFITSTSSLERSESKPSKPMMAHMVQMKVVDGKDWIFMIDANVLDAVPDFEMANLCITCANTRKFNSDIHLRPSIKDELDSIMFMVRKPNADLPRASPIHQLMMYFNPMFGGCETAEWNLKSI